MTKAQKPSILDVARFAGVSKATVSAVLNDAGGVKDTTRDRVLAAVEALNYRADSPGRGGAATRRNRTIGIVVKEHDNPYYAGVIDGVRACVETEGWTIIVASSGGMHDIERRAVTQMRTMGVDGLILTPVLGEDSDLSHFFELKRRNIPFVLLEYVQGVRASIVDVDNASVSRAAVEHLISLGHTRIAHFAGPAYSSHTHERLEGVRRAFSVSHLGLRDEDVIPAGAHLEDGYRAALECFRGRDRHDLPTAVTCYNDLVAIGVCRALRELGLNVPHDMSVIGYDDIPLCEYLPIPLTSVSVPTFKMGQTAARMLASQIESKTHLPPEKMSLNAELVLRASTAPVQVRDRHMAVR